MIQSLIDFILDFLHAQDPAMIGLTVKYLAFIVCLFTVSCIWFLVPVVVRLFQLWVNIYPIRLRMRNRDSIEEDRNRARSRLLRRTSWARHHFNNFYRTWEDARLPGHDRAATPVQLIDFLTPEAVLGGAVNRRLAEALPGILVALGIFGTFMGLMLGLKGLNIDEIANLKQGVGQLLSGLSLAFTSSLLGISFSIIFSFSYRFLIRRLEQSVFALNRIVEQVFPFSSYEHYARKYIELQADIKQGLQTLATDVATSLSNIIGPALDDALARNLVPILGDLKNSLELTAKDLSGQQIEILGGFTDEVAKMGEVISKHFEDSQKKQNWPCFRQSPNTWRSSIDIRNFWA